MGTGNRRRNGRGRLILSVLLAFAGAGSAFANCQPDRVDISGDWGAAGFTVEIADNAEERAQGLMFRESMSSGAGMLFLYDAPHRASFWMKNTLIPLDMIFIGPDGAVLRVHENAVPHDTTPISGGPGVIAVLEINGGLAGRIGIAPGDRVRHPSFGAAALWPCEAP